MSGTTDDSAMRSIVFGSTPFSRSAVSRNNPSSSEDALAELVRRNWAIRRSSRYTPQYS